MDGNLFKLSFPFNVPVLCISLGENVKTFSRITAPYRSLLALSSSPKFSKINSDFCKDHSRLEAGACKLLTFSKLTVIFATNIA